MGKPSFSDRVDVALARIEAGIEAIADDAEIDPVRAGNVLTLTFENGHRIVVNSQAAASELWVAARSGGFHYRWDETHGSWIDTRAGTELFNALAKLVELETGSPVSFPD